MSDDSDTHELDVTGLICPLPVLKIARRLRTMSPGSELAVTATDPATQIDVPHYCAESGHELLDAAQDGTLYRYTIRRS